MLHFLDLCVYNIRDGLVLIILGKTPGTIFFVRVRCFLGFVSSSSVDRENRNMNKECLGITYLCWVNTVNIFVSEIDDVLLFKD